jgi:glycosyltransferase involved in cell wall biosynthesis
LRLVIDLQGAQSISRTRGIGRYSRELALAMARRPSVHDVVIALNGGLPSESLREEFAAILPRDNIRVWHAPGGIGEGTPRDPNRRRAAEAMRAEFLMSLRPDVVHVSSVFEGWMDDTVTAWPSWRARPPVVVTGYDLIPLIRREAYLDSGWKQAGVSQWYLRCLHEMRLADAILAISGSSCDEMIAYLGSDPRHVFNIRAGIGAEFKSPHMTTTERDGLLQRLGLRTGFILFLGGGEFRKNEGGLIRAYGLLPESLRACHQLVIVGKNDEDALRSTAQAAGIDPSELTLIHFVDDADLPALYASCALFVFPSLHEGFGLPAAEAMACGAPVIASNTTSLPEVIGRPDALFDPSDPANIAERMQTVLQNHDFRSDLVSHAVRQAATFTWPDSAARAWKGLEATHARLQHRSFAAPVPGWRLRMACVSPVPPEQSGIADYSAELIPELGRHYDITIVANQPSTNDEYLESNFPVITPTQFLAEADSFDRVLYQIGNSEFHAQQLEHLLPRVAGTVTLHDAYLSGACNWIAHHNGRGRAGFVELLYRSHGWPAALSEMRHGLPAAIRDFPCSLPVLQSAIGIIQHSRHGGNILAAHFGLDAIRDVHIIPHLRQRFNGPERQVARERLGVPADQFLVCSFGYVLAPKLPTRLLAAWQDAGLKTANARLVFVGQTGDGGELMLKQAAARLDQPVERLWTDYVDAETYRTWLAAADVAVQLRTDSRGETSGAILDCMAAGVATVVNDHGSTAELPADTVVRLPADFTDAMLAEALLLLRDPARRQALAAAAQAHVANNLSPRRIAAEYHAAIEAFYADGDAAARQGTTRSLAYALPAHDVSVDVLADSARAMARNFPIVQPPTLLIDASACPTLEQTDPLGALITTLLAAHATDVRVDLVAKRQRRWYHDRARAAALLGLRQAPAPDEPASLVGAAALLCIVPSDGQYEADFAQLRGLHDAGVAIAALFTASPPASTCAPMLELAVEVFCLNPADVAANDAWLAQQFPGRGRTASPVRSAATLMAVIQHARNSGVNVSS